MRDLLEGQAAALLLLAGLACTAAESPEGAHYVASARGEVYYPVGCDAWRGLESRLLFFDSREEAEAEGYRATANRRCVDLTEGPATAALEASEGEGSGSPPEAETARSDPDSCVVGRVIDGDTLECDDGLRIRLLLIDTPEMDQGEWGRTAKRALEQLAPPGTRLGLEYDVQAVDRYGRTLAYAHAAGEMVNARMIGLGMALLVTYPPNVKHVDPLLELQQRARAERRGLWAVDAFACTPADHRAGRCE